MPVKDTSTPLFYDEWSDIGGGGVPYLLGPVQGKITLIKDIEIFWATENKPLRFNAANKTITRGQLNKWTGIPTTPLNAYDNGSFLTDGFRVGDTFACTGAGEASINGYYTIVAVTDTVITVAESLVDGDELSISLYGTTSITAMDYYYGLIENGSPDDYHSLTDRDTQQRFNVTGLDATDLVTVKTLSPSSNSKAWVNGSATIVGMGISGYKQKFRITHIFYILPVYRAGQLTNIENGIPPAPEYFGDRKSLKYVCRVDAKFDNVDPNVPHTNDPRTMISRNGNTGWLDEFMNGGDPEYSLESVQIYNSNAEEVDEIQLNTGDGAALGHPGVMLQGAIILTVRSASAKFGGGMRMILNHQFLPIDEADYMDQRTKQFMDCFKWDRAFLIHGLGPVNGDNYGTDKQVIYQAQMSPSDSSLAVITYYIKMSAAMLADLRARATNDRHYLVSVINQHKDIMTTKGTDANTTKIAVGSYSYDTDNSAGLTVPNGIRFYRWPDEVTNPKTSGNYMSGERAYTRTQFLVHWGSKLNSMKVCVEAYKTGKDPFPLLTRSWNLANNTFTGGITQVDINEFQNYPGDENEPSNRVRCKNMPAISDAFNAGFELDFGFIVGYEYWQALDGADSDFPEASNDWSEYSEVNGWNIRMRVYWSVEDENGIITDFTHSGNLKVRGATWVVTSPVNLTVDIQTWTEDGATQLEGNAILDEANTLVKAVITGNFASLAAIPNAFGAGYLKLGVLNGGGRYEDRIIGTQGAQLEIDSPWIPTDETDKYAIVEYEITSVIPNPPVIESITTSAKLDYTKLPAGVDKFTLGAYFGAVAPQMLILQENGWPLLMEDGGGLLQEYN